MNYICFGFLHCNHCDDYDVGQFLRGGVCCIHFKLSNMDNGTRIDFVLTMSCYCRSYTSDGVAHDLASFHLNCLYFSAALLHEGQHS